MVGFTLLDWGVVGLYVIGIVVLGSMFYKGQHSVKDFFLAGRSIGWFPIALSIIATNLSAISYLGAPAIVFRKDLRYTLTLWMLPVGGALVVWLLARLFYRLQLYTVYEYLETRFNVVLRMIASGLFLVTKVGWLAAAIYTPSLALSVVTEIDLNTCILAVGMFSTLYAVLGGMKAVIWTDVVQFFVLVGGCLVAIGVLLAEFGGSVTTIWSIAAEAGHTRAFDFSLDFTAEFTVFAIIIFSIVNNLYDYGLNQVVVQRYFSAKSLKDSVMGVLGNALLVVPVCIALYFVGLALFAYYSTHPDMMASLIALAPEDPDVLDRVFPHFIVHGIPAGLSGLIIAGIFAATMSTADSGVNSLTTVTVMDIYQRFWHRPEKDDAHYLKAARVGTVFWGIIATLVAILVIPRLGMIIEIMGKIYGYFTGPLVGMFMLGVLTKRANSNGTIVGTILGLIATAVVAKTTDVFWLWYGTTGFVTTFVTGYALSLLWPPPSEEQLSRSSVKKPTEQGK